MELPRTVILAFARKNAARIREIMAAAGVTSDDVGKPDLYDRVAPHLGFDAPRDVFERMVRMLADEGLL